VINYRANKEGGEETLAKVKAITSDCLLVQADVSKEDDVDRLFKAVVDKFGAIDVLVNNAGVGGDKKPFLEAAYEDMKEVIDVHLVSVMMCSRRAVEIMKKQDGGKIINTSSIKGWEYGGGSPMYAVAKAAVNSLTRTLAKHVAPTIQVNAVAPGYVRTRSYDDLPPEKIQGFIDQTYLKRWVTMDEVADAFIFLAKNDAMTGQVLYVDAGFTLK
jgi:3-oxoacyl-[acyl-carrier protein] reductase